MASGNDMGVSKNNGITKSSILIGFSIINLNHPFWGTSPLILDTSTSLHDAGDQSVLRCGQRIFRLLVQHQPWMWIIEMTSRFATSVWNLEKHSLTCRTISLSLTKEKSPSSYFQPSLSHQAACWGKTGLTQNWNFTEGLWLGLLPLQWICPGSINTCQLCCGCGRIYKQINKAVTREHPDSGIANKIYHFSLTLLKGNLTLTTLPQSEWHEA